MVEINEATEQSPVCWQTEVNAGLEIKPFKFADVPKYAQRSTQRRERERTGGRD